LAGPRPKRTAEGILEVAKDIGCLQIDPINVVSRPHVTIPFSRIGRYDVAEFEKLCWEERRLFTYWAHAASMVPTEHYPIHNLLMRRYARGASKWAQQSKQWADANAKLRRHVLLQLRKRGPLRTRDFQDHAVLGFESEGWNEGRNVDRMLNYLWTCGKVMIAGRDGINRVWDLSERWLPEWTPTERLSDREATRRSVVHALRALGVANVKQIRFAFTRWRYYDLDVVLKEMLRRGKIVPITVTAGGKSLTGKWYALPDVLESLPGARRARSRTTVLSPFDNLICDRERTKMLFDFDYTIEIYVPKTKRRYGYYVMPVLHEGRLVGRVDPKMDRAAGVLNINGVWTEEAKPGGSTLQGVARAVHDLARWLGAKDIAVAKTVPPKIRKQIAA